MSAIETSKAKSQDQSRFMKFSEALDIVLESAKANLAQVETLPHDALATAWYARLRLAIDTVTESREGREQA
jgi:hypothetical protein